MPAPPAKSAKLRSASPQELNPLATSENRPVSALKITYLVFPGTAEHPFAPPDLAHWHDRVDALLKEAGGYTGQLFAWKDLTVPPPTPTPSPNADTIAIAIAVAHLVRVAVGHGNGFAFTGGHSLGVCVAGGFAVAGGISYLSELRARC